MVCADIFVHYAFYDFVFSNIFKNKWKSCTKIFRKMENLILFPVVVAFFLFFFVLFFFCLFFCIFVFFFLLYCMYVFCFIGFRLLYLFFVFYFCFCLFLFFFFLFCFFFLHCLMVAWKMKVLLHSYWHCFWKLVELVGWHKPVGLQWRKHRSIEGCSMCMTAYMALYDCMHVPPPAGTCSPCKWREIWWKADCTAQKTQLPCWPLTWSSVSPPCRCRIVWISGALQYKQPPAFWC